MAARGFIGSGELFIERLVNGVSQGVQGPYECSKFEIKPNVELKEQTSRGRFTYGQVIESVALIRSADFTVELPEVNKESLTLALLGTASSVIQASGTITDEAIVAKKGKWVALSKGSLTNVVVENSAGSTTYVLGTDYEVNEQIGMIRVLAASAITESQALNVSATVGAVTKSLIRGGTNADVRAKFILQGANLVDGQPVKVTVHEGIVAADAAFDFMSDEFNTVSLPGKMKTPTGKTEPFTVEFTES